MDIVALVLEPVGSERRNGCAEAVSCHVEGGLVESFFFERVLDLRPNLVKGMLKAGVNFPCCFGLLVDPCICDDVLDFVAFGASKRKDGMVAFGGEKSLGTILIEVFDFIALRVHALIDFFG